MANTTQTPEKRAMRIPEFCAAYGVGRSKFYELVARRELKPRKSAKQTLIPISEAERWFSTLPQMEAELRRYLERGKFTPVLLTLPLSIDAPWLLGTFPVTPVEVYFRLGDE